MKTKLLKDTGIYHTPESVNVKGEITMLHRLTVIVCCILSLCLLQCSKEQIAEQVLNEGEQVTLRKGESSRASDTEIYIINESESTKTLKFISFGPIWDKDSTKIPYQVNPQGYQVAFYDTTLSTTDELWLNHANCTNYRKEEKIGNIIYRNFTYGLYRLQVGDVYVDLDYRDMDYWGRDPDNFENYDQYDITLKIYATTIRCDTGQGVWRNDVNGDQITVAEMLKKSSSQNNNSFTGGPGPSSFLGTESINIDTDGDNFIFEYDTETFGAIVSPSGRPALGDITYTWYKMYTVGDRTTNDKDKDKNKDKDKDKKPG